MDIIARVVWRVKLNDPIDFRDIKPSRSDICTEKDTIGSVTELEECVGTLLLLLLAL